MTTTSPASLPPSPPSPAACFNAAIASYLQLPDLQELHLMACWEEDGIETAYITEEGFQMPG